MEIKIEIPAYSREHGMKYKWEDGFEIEVKIDNGEVLLTANKAGLISLATQLLTLAYTEAAPGAHFHYDQFGSLENGSVDLVIGKK